MESELEIIFISVCCSRLIGFDLIFLVKFLQLGHSIEMTSFIDFYSICCLTISGFSVRLTSSEENRASTNQESLDFAYIFENILCSAFVC